MGLRYAFEYDLPGHDVRFDYGSRTDGQPVYKGLAEAGAATATPIWRIFKFTYADDNCTLKQYASGSWDNRATLF